MLESYKIVKENNEDVLYLYLSMNYEFASDLDNYNLDNLDKEWLLRQRIQFDGNKVVLLVDGIKSKTILLKGNNFFPDSTIFKLDAIDISIEDFLLGCLFKNCKLNLDIETLKAVTILYRSELISLLSIKKEINSKELKYLYQDYHFYKMYYPKTYDIYKLRFLKAIKETDSAYLTYNNKPIKAYIHLVSNGYTESSSNTPYLKVKESFWDMAYPYYLNQTFIKLEDIKKMFNIKDNNVTLEIDQVSEGNRINKLKINDKILNSQELMSYLNLPSTDATILVLKDGFNFITRGIGNGLGLSLVGANALAELGCNYKQILAYYFDNLVLNIKEAK